MEGSELRAALDAAERHVEWRALVDTPAGPREVFRCGPGVTGAEAKGIAGNYLRSGWYRGSSDTYMRYYMRPATLPPRPWPQQYDRLAEDFLRPRRVRQYRTDYAARRGQSRAAKRKARNRAR